MKLLLDTHSFLWFIDGNLRLSTTARQLIEDPANERLVSIASLWEMAIKASMGRLIFAHPFATLMPEQLQRNSMQVLEIIMAHIAQVASLPFHHRDPSQPLSTGYLKSDPSSLSSRSCLSSLTGELEGTSGTMGTWSEFLIAPEGKHQ